MRETDLEARLGTCTQWRGFGLAASRRSDVLVFHERSCSQFCALTASIAMIEPGRWLLRKPWVCGPTVTAGRSNFGHNSRVLGLGGKWTAPGYRAVRRHGLISLPLERGLFVADIVRRPLCNVPHYVARLNVLGRITSGGTDVLGRPRIDQLNPLLRPSCQHRPMSDDDHSSMSAILTGIRRAFASRAGRVRILGRAPEPVTRSRTGESCRTRAVARAHAACRLRMGSHALLVLNDRPGPIRSVTLRRAATGPWRFAPRLTARLDWPWAPNRGNSANSGCRTP